MQQQIGNKLSKTLPWAFGYFIVWLILDQLFLKTGLIDAHKWLSKFGLLLTITFLLFNNRKGLLTLWNQTGSGFNLAVWRILFFGSILVTGLFFDVEHIKMALFSMTHMTLSSRVPLPFWGSITYLIPISESLSMAAFYILIISCVFSMIGLLTQWSILLFTLSAFYLFGVTQLFGKVNHNHYFVWFPAILAFSGCGDVLSLDYLVKTRKAKDQFKLPSGKKYGRALASIWLLIGIIYFFPGFHKIWENGFDWVLSDNFSNIIHLRIFELSSWAQPLPVQNYPILCVILAAFTILFEIGFIFIITQPKYRLLAVLTGTLFHLGTWLILNIFFQFLLVAYLSFVNWEKVFYGNKASNFSGIIPQESTSLTKIALFLLVANSFCGFFNIHTWPVSCFPTFAEQPGKKTEALEFVEFSKENTSNTIQLGKFHKIFPTERYRSLELRAIRLYKESKTQEFVDLIHSLTKRLNLKNKTAVYLVNISWKNGTFVRDRGLKPLIYLE